MKAGFYMDKSMRGKTEGDESVVKRVVVASVLDWRAEKEKKLAATTKIGADEEKKDKNKHERMPSLAHYNISVVDGERFIRGYQPTVNILPYYTEVDYQKRQIYGKKPDQKALKKLLDKEEQADPTRSIRKTSFQSECLLHLNNPPKHRFGYLKERSLLKRPNKFIAPILDVATIGKFKGVSATEYKPLNQEEMLKKI